MVGYRRIVRSGILVRCRFVARCRLDGDLMIIGWRHRLLPLAYAMMVLRTADATIDAYQAGKDSQPLPWRGKLVSSNPVELDGLFSAKPSCLFFYGSVLQRAPYASSRMQAKIQAKNEGCRQANSAGLTGFASTQESVYELVTYELIHMLIHKVDHNCCG